MQVKALRSLVHLFKLACIRAYFPKIFDNFQWLNSIYKDAENWFFEKSTKKKKQQRIGTICPKVLFMWTQESLSRSLPSFSLFIRICENNCLSTDKMYTIFPVNLCIPINFYNRLPYRLRWKGWERRKPFAFQLRKTLQILVYTNRNIFS